ncbi:MAG: metallophosphoesterase, partial [Bacteroidota bacterium]
ENQQDILRRVEELRPDLILFTGDLIDCHRVREAPGLTLMSGLRKIAPVYAVNGNHEVWSGRDGSLKRELSALGVSVLANRRLILPFGRDRLLLHGIDDPRFKGKMSRHARREKERKILARELQNSLGPEKGFRILLSHRPEGFEEYQRLGVDLVFAGHTHGGQVRLPFFGGLIAPNQGLFPKYLAGRYEKEGCTMIVNRGLGSSRFPLRLFNRPEIVVVRLISNSRPSN